MNPTGPVLLVTSTAAIEHHDAAPQAQRHAHRWLRRSAAQLGEWVTILDVASGATVKRYVMRNGRVERAQ